MSMPSASPAVAAAAVQAAVQVYRGSILHFTGDPASEQAASHWHEDGLLLIRDGRVQATGDYAALRGTLPDGAVVTDYRGRILVPGFIDTHVHYPQIDMIASPAPGLLDWLESYTFNAERKFEQPAYARQVAGFFLDELLRCGTTSAMVYCSVHPQAAEAFFIESEQRNMRMAAGKVLMDRNCPEFLRDTADGGIRDTEQLIHKWHGRGRQMVAITPRFAATSSDTQLQLSGELAAAYPDTFIQTHVAENTDEIAWIKTLFPDARSYLDVYDRHGLLRARTMLAHCIWLDQRDRLRMADSHAAAAVCPTSNLFLGSGLFDFAAADAAGMLLSLATDVGAGTSLSMLQTMNEAYKVARLKGTHLSALRLFYLATLGGARSMQLAGTIGNFAAGNEADFIVLDPRATPLLAHRTARSGTIEELLFALAMLGDDRTVEVAYIAGRRLYTRPQPQRA